jgi:hypothetical protein
MPIKYTISFHSKIPNSRIILGIFVLKINHLAILCTAPEAIILRERVSRPWSNLKEQVWFRRALLG